MSIPPDPENLNDDRADWAGQAIAAFAHATRMDTVGEDAETMLGDLLADLMHWCDRNNVDFETQLACARSNYAEETRPNKETRP